MKISISKFGGLKPIQDIRTPDTGLAVVCRDAYLHRTALYPFPKPEATAYNISTGSSRILMDDRRLSPLGGSYKAGAATETFPDSELLYILDPVNGSRIVDGSGVWHEVVPPQPVADGAGHPKFSISAIGVELATGYNAIGMSRFDINKAEAEIAPASDVENLQSWIVSTASNLWSTVHPTPVPDWVDAISLSEVVRWVFINAKAMPYLLQRSSGSSFCPVTGDIGEGLSVWNYMQSLAYAGVFSTIGRTKYSINGASIPVPYRGGVTVQQTHVPGTANSCVTSSATTGQIAAFQFGSAITEYVQAVMVNPNLTRPAPTTQAGTANLYGYVRVTAGSAFADCNTHTESPIGYYRPAFPLAMLPAVIDQILIELDNTVIANTNTGATTVDLWQSLEDSIDFWFAAVPQAFRSRSAGQSTPGGEVVPFVIGETKLADGTDEWKMPIPRAYCYTWIDAFGRESAPSLPVTVLDDVALAREHRITITEPPPANMVGAQVYRAVSSPHAAEPGKVDSRFLRCMWIPTNGNMNLVNLPPYDEAIGFELESQEYIPVPADASYMRETHGGYLVWSTNQDTMIQFSLRHIWYATHPTRTIQLPRGWKVMGIETVGDEVYVITDHKPLFIQPLEDKGVDGMRLDVMTIFNAPSGCLSSASICSTAWGVAYSSPVGMVVLHQNKAALPLTSMYDPQDWGAVSPTTCSAYWDGRYFGFREGSAIVVDLPDPQMAQGRIASVTTLSVGADAAFADPYGHLYILPHGSNVLHMMHLTGDVLEYTYKTTEIPHESQAVWTTIYLAGTGGDTDVTLWCDGRIIMHRLVPVNKLVRIPRHAAGFKFQVQLVGKAHLNEVTIATTGTENVSFRGQG